VNPFSESPGIPYTRRTPDAFSVAAQWRFYRERADAAGNVQAPLGFADDVGDGGRAQDWIVADDPVESAGNLMGDPVKD
jgi:hypothetical protein